MESINELLNKTKQNMAQVAQKLNKDLGIPATLSELGVTEDKIEAMAVDAMKAANIKANPRQTNIKDIIALYHKAM